MEAFRHGHGLQFSIDEIFPLREFGDVFVARIIPNIHSRLFPPFHLRYIHVVPDLLDKHFYEALRRNNEDLPELTNSEFKSSVIQGGYYEIPRNEVPKDIFNSERIIGSNNDIFKEYLKPSPFIEKEVTKEDFLSLEDGIKHLDTPPIRPGRVGSLYVYCFDVGQGDSCMVIFPNGAVYLIDTNCYQNTMTHYISRINRILARHQLPHRRIKSLIITHKHIDHLRGALEIVERFSIKNFIINLDYEHPTRAVYDLLSQSRRIPTWINCNEPGEYLEGEVYVYIKNPDSETRDKTNAPDINDSSIGLWLKYGANSVYLTGDAGNSVICNKFVFSMFAAQPDNLLKVSHHGSNTGTNSAVLNVLRPSHNFISAGVSNKYNHPHQPIVDMIQRYPKTKRTDISSERKQTVCYEITGRGILTRLL